MSTSLLYHAFGITGNYKYQATHYDKGTIVFKIIPTKPYRCPCCNSRTVIKRGTRLRRLVKDIQKNTSENAIDYPH